AYHAGGPGKLALPDLTVREAPGGSARVAKVDLTLELWATANGWAGAFEYATDLFASQRVARLVGHWTTLLAALAETDAATAVTALPWLTAAERTQVLTAWNRTA